MKRRLFNYPLFYIFLLPFHLFAQSAAVDQTDITGLWKGTLYNDTTQKFLPYQLAISEEEGKLNGYSYTLFDIDGKKEWGIKQIKIKWKDDQLILEDIALISNNYSEPPPKKVRVLSIVKLVANDSLMQLTGSWSTNQTREYRPLTGTLLVQRIRNYRPMVLFEKLAMLKLDGGLSFVKIESRREPGIAIQEGKIPNINLPALLLRVDDLTPEMIPLQSNRKSSSLNFKPIGAGLIASATPQVYQAKKVASVDSVATFAGMKTNSNTVASAGIKNVNKGVGLNKNIVVPFSPAHNNPPLAVSQNEGKNVAAITSSTVKNNAAKVKATRETVVATNPSKGVMVAINKPVINNQVYNNQAPPITVIENPGTTATKSTSLIDAVAAQQKKVMVMDTVAASKIAERKTKPGQSVFFESDSLVLTLYDNGEVDGDTVSVLMNGRIIFARQGLSTIANSKTIYFDKGMPDSLSMIMYAENLGSIPPNTGLLIIMDGEKRYEVRFSADLTTNASIIFRRKPAIK